MTSLSRVKGGAIAAVVAVAVALPAVAFAASRPKRGIWGSQFVFTIPMTGNISMKHVRSPSYCTRYHNWQIKKVGMRNGTFNYSGTTTTGQHATLKGSFVTPKRVKGTIKIGRCAQTTFRAHWIAAY